MSKGYKMLEIYWALSTRLLTWVI